MTIFKSSGLGLIASLLCGAAFAQTIDVKLGVLNDRSGIYADIAGEGSVVAARMAAEDFDAAGKSINVDIISADHQNKADIASNIARQWLTQEGVNAILDVPNSSAAFAVSELTRDNDAVFIISGAGATDLTGQACSPHTVHWTYDTWSMANGTGTAMVAEGGDSWFFITADYAFGHSLEKDTADTVIAHGGTVAGQVRHPFPGNDFSSHLLQAQASGAKVIGLANAAGDLTNVVKQASEFGITQAGQKLVGMLIFLMDIHSLGLETAQGLYLTSPFYWDQNDDTREWTARFEALHKTKPTMIQAGVYAGTLHYLKAVEATGSTDADTLMAWMKANPTDDPLFGKGEIRPDGRHIHDMYLFRVKSPAQSTGPWDYYEQIATIPADKAFRPMADGNCPLVQ